MVGMFTAPLVRTVIITRIGMTASTVIFTAITTAITPAVVANYVDEAIYTDRLRGTQSPTAVSFVSVF
jgi:hypothetical protein